MVQYAPVQPPYPAPTPRPSRRGRTIAIVVGTVLVLAALAAWIGIALIPRTPPGPEWMRAIPGYQGDLTGTGTVPVVSVATNRSVDDYATGLAAAREHDAALQVGDVAWGALDTSPDRPSWPAWSTTSPRNP